MKFVARTYLEVDSFDLDSAISDEFDIEFECIASEEWNNDSSYVINVDGKNDEYDQRKVDERKNMYVVHAYMNDMAKRNIIPVGQYLVRVCW